MITESSTLTEVDSSYIKGRRELIEHFQSRQERLNANSLETKFEYQIGNQDKRTIPYSDDESLRKVRNTGRWLHTKPTVRNCTDIMLSFVIKNGHSYSFFPRIPAKNSERRQRQQQNAVEALTFSLAIQMERIGWRRIQHETYLRQLRDGDCFRRSQGRGFNLDVWFIEPEFINQPRLTSLLQILNLEEVPEAVIAPFSTTHKVAGEYGVVRNPDDIRQVLGYWEHLPKEGPNGQDAWMWLHASEVQHFKDGVDDSDPRGIPRFYWSLCNNLAIDEVNGGMIDLTLIQAEHAAIYNFDTKTSTQQNLLDMAKNRTKRQEHFNSGRPSSPGVVHARAFQVDLPGMNIDAKDFIEIIQQEQRFTGGYSGIPEHMATLDANTGNRSSLVAAEGPFDRRVQMEQTQAFEADRVILWKMIEEDVINKINPVEYSIEAHFPVAASRDASKEIASEISLVEARLKSKKQARKKLHIDNEQANAEIMQEDIDDPLLDTATDSNGQNSPNQGVVNAG